MLPRISNVNADASPPNLYANANVAIANIDDNVNANTANDADSKHTTSVDHTKLAQSIGSMTASC